MDGAVLGVAARHFQSCRAGPKVVVHCLGWLLNPLFDAGVADRGSAFVAGSVSDFALAELAGLDVIDGRAHPRIASALGADLADAIELAGGLGHQPTFMDVVAGRLLDVNIFARGHRPNRHERVPMVRCGDRNDIDRLVFDHLANVLLELRLGFLPLADLFHGIADDRLIAIADGDDLAVVFAEEAADMVHAAPMHADDGHAKPIVGGLFLDRFVLGGVAKVRADGRRGRGEQRPALDKLASIERIHGKVSIEWERNGIEAVSVYSGEGEWCNEINDRLRMKHFVLG